MSAMLYMIHNAQATLCLGMRGYLQGSPYRIPPAARFT